MGLLSNAETEGETTGNTASTAGVTDATVKATAGAADIPDAAPSPAVAASTPAVASTPATAPAAASTAPAAASTAPAAASTVAREPAPADQASANATDQAAVDAAAAATAALVPQGGRQLAVAASRIQSAYSDTKDVMIVDYNTLPQVILSNGNFMARETKEIMGDAVGFDLISHQDAWVVSPEDDAAPNDVVKYSNDGKFTTEGVPVQEAIDYMHKNGYPKARLKQRAVLVVAIISASKTDKFNNTLMQLDLSPVSKTMWDRLQFNVTYQLKIGVINGETKSKMKGEAKIQTKGTNTFTYAEFSLRT